MLIHGKPGIFFKCQDLTCLLNDTFNYILFTEHSAVQAGKSHSVGFAVSVNYIDFIKTISSNYSLNSNLEEIFNFSSQADLETLKTFVSKQKQEDVYNLIEGLMAGKMPQRKAIRKEYKYKKRNVRQEL